MTGIVTRWLRKYRGHKAAVKRASHTPNERNIAPYCSDEDFVWPNINDVIHSQRQYHTNASNDAVKSVPSAHTVKDKIWILDQSYDLQLRILIIAHCGTGGHCEAELTASILQERYTWSTMKDDAHQFVSNCIHCILAKSVEKIPRPIALTIPATSCHHTALDQINRGHPSRLSLYRCQLKRPLGYIRDQERLIILHLAVSHYNGRRRKRSWSSVPLIPLLHCHALLG